MQKRYVILVAICVMIFAAVEVPVPLFSQDCSAITDKGIFDVHTTRSQEDLIADIIHWLSVNDLLTERDAQSAAIHEGIVLPNIPVPINGDLTYGNNRDKFWSHAAASYLQQNIKDHKSFEDTFISANPNIVNAWKECVQNVKGLVCFAKQTDNPNDILLYLEVRPLTRWVSPFLRVKNVTYSANVQTDSKIRQILGFGSPTPYLFKRKAGSDRALAVTFAVYTSSADYRCTAHAPALPEVKTVETAVLKHQNRPIMKVLVAFDNKHGYEEYGNGEWSRRGGIEQIDMNFEPPLSDLHLQFSCHQAGFGNQPRRDSGNPCGLQDKFVHLEDVTIWLTGESSKYYSLSYGCLVYMEAKTRLVHEGEPCGAAGNHLPLQQLMIKVEAKPEYQNPQ